MAANSSKNEMENTDPRVSVEYIIDSKPIKRDSNNNEWYRFKLFINPKSEFELKNIEKVVYLLPSTFDPPNIASIDFKKNFEIELDSQGGFLIQAVILFRDKEILKLTRYLPIGKVFTDPSSNVTNPAEFWTDYAMKQAQYWTSFGLDQTKGGQATS
jgi:hypothetical protein